MAEAGTYGEFPPLKDSFFYYHDTYAYAMMPLTKEEAIAAGARWRKDEVHADTKGIPTISNSVVCPQERLLNRFRNRESSYELYESKCAECSRDIQTTYDPAKGLRVYCEQCYQAEVS